MPLRSLSLLGLLAALPLSPAHAAEPCCAPVVHVHGSAHYVKPDGLPAQMQGQRFIASVSNLEPGPYLVEVDLAETEFREPGQRQIQVEIARQKVAEHLDPFAEAGFGQIVTVQGEVDHLGDAQRGPLEVRFTGRKGEAVFAEIRVFNDQGELAARLTAEDLSAMVATADTPPEIKGPVLFRDPSQPRDARVDDLIRRMTLSEKAAQLVNGANAVERLGVPEYDYWNECLHGVARAGVATVFPQAIGMAATWDPALLQETADIIATEARAKHHESARNGERGRYHGLTFWTPNINIFRDPRWGRGQETYGEDPYLTGVLGVSFIRGLQGDDPNYLKVMACAKHFAVHSGPEPERHWFDATAPETDFYDTYLPHFEMAVKEGSVGSVMSAYNRVDGESATSSHFLLTEILRDQWGFDGHVVSDCGAVFDIWARHKIVDTPAAAVARSIQAGCDLNCGSQYFSIPQAVQTGLLSEAEVDRALHRVLLARFQLGMFDPPEDVPYASIPFDVVDSPEHAQQALDVARESLVLLSNHNTLPLDLDRLQTIAVIGANADSVPMLLGNYNGTPSAPVTILQGIRDAVGDDVEVLHATGAPLVAGAEDADEQLTAQRAEAVQMASRADVVIYVGGISPQLEGEEMRVDLPGFRGGDRTSIELPESQTELLHALHATGKPVVFVNCSGSAIALPWEAEHLGAILQAWYPGQAGGTAVADVLFGRYNPSGRLPVTFNRSTDDLPPFEDYAMAGRTYRYFEGEPLFAFGHGLSYTTFAYGKPRLIPASARPDGTVRLKVEVRNEGKRDGDEVVQIYALETPSATAPLRRLIAFARVPLKAGEKRTVELEIPLHHLRLWNPDTDAYEVAPGSYTLGVGRSSADIRQQVKLKVAQSR
ncbi:MAG: glycoside hydrolase family 3 C-terminal domain-containing protein [Verrucomicrobiota bacterium JB022]|nr:glycoside hydrolase family 3 C-terminal domain-containing protein [Verrucomicrobiota bacterium JB022]